MPLKKLTPKMTRIVRQTAKNLSKSVQFEIIGDDISVDKSIFTAVGASLTHMLRNSLDHGLESQEERQNKGKNPNGQIKLHFKQTKDSLLVKITDDGRGLNVEKIKTKAIEKDLISESQAQEMSPQEIGAFIFLPGFSTAEKITDVSGRGVGMDAALSMVRALGGEITIENTSPSGTEFQIEIPFLKTVSMDQCLIVESDGIRYALPLDCVKDIQKGHDLSLVKVGSYWIANFNKTNLMLMTLNQKNGLNNDFDQVQINKKMFISIKTGMQQVGLLVDRVLYQTDAVTQALPKTLKVEKFVLGTAILGDDQIAFVVDPNEMLNLFYQKTTPLNVTEQNLQTAC